MGPHIFDASTVCASPSADAPILSLFVPPWVDDPVLRLHGRVERTALLELGTMLDEAVADTTGTVSVDVAAVDSWSLLAQAMVLNTSRVLAARDRLLVLVGPSSALRDGSERLRIFERVTTEPAD